MSAGLLLIDPLISRQFALLGSKLANAEFAPMSFGQPQVVLELSAQPALRRRIECDGKADRHFRADTGSTVQDRRKRLPTNPERLGSCGDRHPERVEEQITQNLAWMGRIVHRHGSVIVLVIDVESIAIDEPESDTPVTTYAHRPGPLARPGNWVKRQAREIHVSWTEGNLKAAENRSKALLVLRMNA